MYQIQMGNTIMIADRVKMLADEKSAVKQFYVRTPHYFKDRPVVTVTVSTEVATAAYVVYGVEESKHATGETIFKVSTITRDVTEANGEEYWCDYVLIGELSDEPRD